MNPTNNNLDQRHTRSSYGPSLDMSPAAPITTYPTSRVSLSDVSPPVIHQPPVDHSKLRYDDAVAYDSSLETTPSELTRVVGAPAISTPQTELDTTTPVMSEVNTRSNGFSPFRYNRTALLATIVAISFVALVGLATLFLGSHTSKSSTTSQSSSTPSSQYAVSNLPLSSSSITSQLKVGTAEQLTINGQLLVNNTVILAPGTAPATPVTGQFYYNQTTNQPYYYNGTTFVSLEPGVTTVNGLAGTVTNVCILGATNCGFAMAGSGVTTVNGLAGSVTNVCIQADTNCGFAMAGSGVTTVNGLASALTIADTTGTGNTITIQDASTTQKGIAQFNTTNFTSTAGVIDTIQAITTTSDVQFASLGLGTASTTGNLTLGTSGSLIANNLTHTGNGNNLVLDSGADNISFTNGSGTNTFFLPTSGGIGQVICTTGITCASGGGQAVILDPSGIQSSNTNTDALAINKASGTGNLITLQTAGVDALVINSSGNTTISNTTTITSLQTNSITPTAALTIGSTTQSYTLQGNASSTIAATNAGSTTAIGFITPTANVNYQFGTATAGTYSVCTTATLCAGYAPSAGSSGYLQLQATTPGSAQTGNINITGISIAGTFSGSGASLTSLNGTNISSGTVADARLSANVALLNATQTFTSANTFSSALTLGITGTNTGSILFKGSTAASGTLTLIGQSNPATNTLALPNETGTICSTGSVCTGYAPSAGSGSYAPITGGSNYLQLQATTPGTAQTGNSNITGASIAGTFSGSGVSLTSLNGTNISSGTVADLRLTTNVTLQGNTFNGVSQLVQTTAGGILPVLSGANLTNLNATNIASGTVADARLTNNVTVQGNTFNGASQLVQLNGSTQLPVASGVLLTNLNGTSIASGTVADARLSANVALLSGTQTFTGNNKFTGTLLSQNASNSTAAFQVQNTVGNELITVDTSGSRVTLGKASTLTGSLAFYNAAGTGNVSLTASNPGAGAFGIILPAANGTVCLTSGNCAGVGGTGDVLQGGNSFGTAVTLGTKDNFGFNLITNNTTVASLSNTGTALFKNAANSTIAFQVQNFAGNAVFTTDTTNGQTILGTSSSLTGKLQFLGSGGAGTLTVAGPTTPNVGNYTLTIPAITANANVCTDNSVCSGYSPSTGGTGYLQLQATTPGTAQTGNSNITGTSIAGTFSGSGASLTSLNGSNISSGTVADVRLSANVALLNGPQTFTGNNTFTGTLLSQNAANSTVAFQVQNAANAAIFTTDTTNSQAILGTASSVNGKLQVLNATNANTITIVSGATTATYSLTLPTAGPATSQCLQSDATTASQLKFAACSNTHTKTVILTAEYAGAILDAGSGANNSGTMTSGIDLTNRENYYKWITTQVTSQSYDVDIQVPIPSDFSSWAGTPISIDTYTTDTTNGTIQVEARTTAGSIEAGCNFVAITPSANNTWQTKTGCTIAGTYTAGGYMTLRLRMYATSAVTAVQVGNITLNYNSAY